MNMGFNNIKVTVQSLVVKILIGIFAYSVLPTLSYGQIVTAVLPSSDTIEMGDPLTVKIRLSLPKNIDYQYISFLAWKDLSNIHYLDDTLNLEPKADIEIIDGGEWNITSFEKNIPIDLNKFNEKDTNYETELTIQIAIYNAGKFLVPGPEIISDSTLEALPTESRYISVLWPKTLTQSDSLTLEPIKNIMKEAAQLSDYLIYIIALLLVLIFVAYRYYIKKYKKKALKAVDKPIEPILPAHLIALEALKKLDEKELWQMGKIKIYQSELTSIIRQYLCDRYNIKAQNMTTEEIIMALSAVSLSEIQKNDLRNILNVADLVKFAKAQPDTDVHTLFMNKSVQFVEDTQSPFGETHDKTILE